MRSCSPMLRAAILPSKAQTVTTAVHGADLLVLRVYRTFQIVATGAARSIFAVRDLVKHSSMAVRRPLCGNSDDNGPQALLRYHLRQLFVAVDQASAFCSRR
jgi:hypothetical protein